MKKKAPLKPTPKARILRSSKHRGYGDLISSIFSLNTKMVQRVATVANQSLVLRNWMIGAYIVEFATAGMDQKLFVSRYLTALPTVEQLKTFLERDRAEFKNLK